MGEPSTGAGVVNMVRRRLDGASPKPSQSYRNRLRRRLAPLLVLFIIVAVSVVGWGSRRTAATLLRERTLVLLRMAARNLQDHPGDPAATRRILDELVLHPERQAAALVRDGRVLAISGRSGDLRRMLRDAASLAEDPGRVNARVSGFGPFSARLVAVARLDGSRFLVLEQRMHGLGTPFTTWVLLVMLISAGLAMAAVLLVSDAVYRPVVRRLDTLKEGLARYGAGDTAVRLPVPPASRDEFDRVFEAFNAMADRICELERERLQRMDDEYTLLANLAHDISTPITVLRGFSETLAGRGSEIGSARLEEIHGEMLSQAIYVEAIVEDLLTLARERSARLRIEPVPVELDDVIDHVLDTLQAPALRRGIAVFGDAGGLSVYADPVRLRQVLTNLVRNSILHGHGATTVEITARRRDGGVLIGVRDDGCGVPPERVPSLFEQYRRGGSSSEGGWGLGLFIVRTLVEIHGGWVRFVPEDPGSRFEVWFPDPRKD